MGDWGFEPNLWALVPELLSLPLGGPIGGGSPSRSLVKVAWVHARAQQLTVRL